MLDCNGTKSQQNEQECSPVNNNNAIINNRQQITSRQYNMNSINSTSDINNNTNNYNLSTHSNGILNHLYLNSSNNNSNGFQPSINKKKLFSNNSNTNTITNTNSYLKAKNIFEQSDDPESSNHKNNSKTTAVNSRSSMISHFDEQDQLDSLKEGTSCSLNFQINKPFNGFLNSFQGIRNNNNNNLSSSNNNKSNLLFDNSINNFSSSLFLNNSNNNMSININNNNNTIRNNNNNLLTNGLQDFLSPTYTQGSFNLVKSSMNSKKIMNDNNVVNNTQKQQWGVGDSLCYASQSKLSLINTPKIQQQQQKEQPKEQNIMNRNNQEDDDEDLFNKESLSVLWAKPSDLLAQTKQNLILNNNNTEQNLLLIDGNLKQQLNRKLLGESTFHKKNNNLNGSDNNIPFTPSTMSHLNSNINLNNPTNNYLDDDDKGERSSRGLRNLSLKVKQIVVQRVETSYKEVADQLVDELRSQNQGAINQEEIQKDEQNIKRRVYDALNVLIASKVIEKQGKVVKSCEKSRLNGRCLQADNWKNVKQVESERDKKKEILKQKQKTLNEYAAKYLALMNLISRNKKQEQDRLNNQLSQQSVDFLNNQDQIQELSQRMNNIKDTISLKDKMFIDTHDYIPANSNQSNPLSQNQQQQQQQQLQNVNSHIFQFPLILINVPVSSNDSSKVIVKMSRDQKNGKFFSQSKMIVNSDLDILIQMKMHEVDQKFALQYLDQELITKYFMGKSFSIPFIMNNSNNDSEQDIQNSKNNANDINNNMDIEEQNNDSNENQIKLQQQSFNNINNKSSLKKNNIDCDDGNQDDNENTNSSINQIKSIKSRNNNKNQSQKNNKLNNKINKKLNKNNLFDANNSIELD